MIDERQVREMLERRAETISATPADAPKAIRLARRRLARNAAMGAVMALAVVAGTAAGLRMTQAAPPPPQPATRPPAPAISGALAYARDGDIYVADSDGSNAVRIADGCSQSECVGNRVYYGADPMWSPDGRYLSYPQVCPMCSEEASVGVVISDPHGNVVAEFLGAQFDGGISWSPDSTRVATWVTYGETMGVFGVDGARHALLSVPPETVGHSSVPLRWSPDGESLVVEDVVIPLDGSDPYKLPMADRGLVGGPWYSPDGSRVAYVGENHKPLVVAEADGSNPRVVFDGPVVVGSTEIVWSPAGDRIAFTSSKVGTGRGTVNELRVVDLDTGTVTLLAEALAAVAGLSVIDFSPEGDRILFAKWEIQSTGSLWSVNVDGSDLRRLLSGTSGDWRPAGVER